MRKRVPDHSNLLRMGCALSGLDVSGVALQVLELLAASRSSLDSDTAATMAVTLQHLTSASQTLTPTAINTTLSVASLLANKTVTADERVASGLIASMSSVISAGALGEGEQR